MDATEPGRFEDDSLGAPMKKERELVKKEPTENIKRLVAKFKNICISFDIDCPFCSKEVHLLATYAMGVPVKHFCTCGKIFSYRLRMKGTPRSFRTLIEIRRVKEKGKKFKI